MKLSEKMIENQILVFLKFKGILAWKTKTVGTYDQKLGRFRKSSPLYRKGIADVCGILAGGRFFCCEVKSQRGRLRPEQKTFLEDVTRNGGLAFVARSVEDVEKALREAGG